MTLGIDAHKRTHTVVAVDDVGRRLGVKTGMLRAEEQMVRVPPKLMAHARDAPTYGKSDPIDALAVAALANLGLPVARLDGPTRELRLLVDHREDLVAERTRCAHRPRTYLDRPSPAATPRPRPWRRAPPKRIDVGAKRA